MSVSWDTVSRTTKEDAITEINGELLDVLKTSGLWIMLRKSDKLEFQQKVHKIANEFVEKAIQ